jgi:hypothetical protein
VEPLVGEQRRELVEVRPLLRLLGVHAVDRVDLQQREVLLAVLGLPHLAGDGIALAQHEPPDLRERDIDVLLPRQVAGGPQEPVTLGQDVEQPGRRRGGGEFLLLQLDIALAAILALATALLAGRTPAGAALAVPLLPALRTPAVRTPAVRTPAIGSSALSFALSVTLSFAFRATAGAVAIVAAFDPLGPRRTGVRRRRRVRALA